MAATAEVATGARVRIDGLKARPELNGSLGVVEGLNSDTGRWNVLIDDMREAIALKLDALTVSEDFAGIVVGTRVRIAGLDKKPELNGKLGTVESFQGERASVYVDAIREKVALKRDALAIADAAPSSKEAAASDERAVKVELDGVALKLTLSASQLAKPFSDSVLKPFLKAYAKKKELKPIDIKEVAQVTIDSDSHTEIQILKDIHIFSAEQCLKGAEGDIDIEVKLKGDDRPVAPAPKKKVERLPMNARVLVHGLTSRASEALNGVKGKVTGLDESKEPARYSVTLEDGKVLSVRMANLIDISAQYDQF